MLVYAPDLQVFDAIGPVGDDGKDGPTGPTGPMGHDGATGAAGIPGSFTPNVPAVMSMTNQNVDFSATGSVSSFSTLWNPTINIDTYHMPPGDVVGRLKKVYFNQTRVVDIYFHNNITNPENYSFRVRAAGQNVQSVLAYWDGSNWICLELSNANDMWLW